MISKEEIKTLKRFGRILNEEIRDGKVDPIIGRGNEIRRVTEILSRKKKNNPLLIGAAGVGKTAIVEGLALSIVNQEVPENLRNRTVFELNISLLVSGSKMHGQFEERLNNLLAIFRKNADVIVFIDELHLIVGAGKTSGTSDAANILKPTLARGEIRLIGATTFDEYRRFIEKDNALERRFQTIMVSEPTVDETIAILRGLKKSYENYHEISIRDEALIAAVELSMRFIPQRNLPDKAIDLIDEAASRRKIES
nr:probable chaperone protein ClpB 2 [Lytechinus pictus]